jgi:hypothetical protein
MLRIQKRLLDHIRGGDFRLQVGLQFLVGNQQQILAATLQQLSQYFSGPIPRGANFWFHATVLPTSWVPGSRLGGARRNLRNRDGEWDAIAPNMSRLMFTDKSLG